MDQVMLRIKDVMERLDATREAVLSWIASGEIEAVDVSPHRAKHRQWRVSNESLEKFLASRSPRNASKPALKDSPENNTCQVLRFV